MPVVGMLYFFWKFFTAASVMSPKYPVGSTLKKPSFFRLAWRVLTASLLMPFFNTGFDEAKAHVEDARSENRSTMLIKMADLLRTFIG